MTVNAAAELRPALALIAERRATGGGPGAHGDGHRLALAIEGGGMRGTITAGMALGVHELGLCGLRAVQPPAFCNLEYESIIKIGGDRSASMAQPG